MVCGKIINSRRASPRVMPFNKLSADSVALYWSFFCQKLPELSAHLHADGIAESIEQLGSMLFARSLWMATRI